MAVNFPVQMIQGGVPPGNDVEFVNVGDAGNTAYSAASAAWTTSSTGQGHGDVAYEFQMAKYATPVYVVEQYNNDPINSSTQLSITNTAGFPNHPCVGLTWNQAARFVNWLNIKEGKQPAYDFADSSVTTNITLWPSSSAWQNGGENLFRHKDAKYFLPSEDEWIKAAFYDPNYTGGNGYDPIPGGGGYNRWALSGYDYSTLPNATSGGTDSDRIVWKQSGNSSNDQARADVKQAGGLSPYGTMGQTGNCYEFIESATDGTNDSVSESRIIRGGTSTISVFGYVSIDSHLSYPPTSNPGTGGFRVAKAAVGTGHAP